MKDPGWLVVVGASAGGVEALSAFFAALPTDIDAAFLVVLHIPPHTESRLQDVLGRQTTMPVSAAGDRDAIRAGHVYVGRADMHLTVDGRRLRLTRGPRECRARPAVDVLFRSAAVAYGPRAIGVVLSGMLDDGTAGLWAIKERLGRALVQAPGDAMFDGMPSSAMEHVGVDLVGSAATLAAEVARIVRAEPVPSPVGAGPTLHETEALIAAGGNALELGVMQMGQVSQYTCPDCHGVLVQIEEGSIVRFRCHTGHAFSLQTLLAEVSETIDKRLWDSVRAIEERILLLRQLADLATRRDEGKSSAQYTRLADETESRIKPIRELVLDERLFGRQS